MEATKFNILFSNPKFNSIAQGIFKHMESKELAKCRQVSKSWKTWIDNSSVYQEYLRVQLGKIRDRHGNFSGFLSRIYDQMIKKATIKDLKTIIVYIKQRESIGKILF